VLYCVVEGEGETRRDVTRWMRWRVDVSVCSLEKRRFGVESLSCEDSLDGSRAFYVGGWPREQ
jgi:hypothetical protein